MADTGSTPVEALLERYRRYLLIERGLVDRLTSMPANAALIYLARRRVDVLHAMLRTKTPYQPKPADEPASRLDKPP